MEVMASGWVSAASCVFAAASGQAGCYVHYYGGHVSEGAGDRDQVRDTAEGTARDIELPTQGPGRGYSGRPGIASCVLTSWESWGHRAPHMPLVREERVQTVRREEGNLSPWATAQPAGSHHTEMGGRSEGARGRDLG